MESKVKEKRLAELLLELGLISSKQIEKAILQTEQSGKSLAEILQQDVSLQSLKQLFGYKILSPSQEAQTYELQQILSELGVISEKDLQESHRITQSFNIKMGNELISQGIISQEQLAEAVQIQKETNTPLWRVLINLRYVSPQQMADLIKGHYEKSYSPEGDELIIDLLIHQGILHRKQKKQLEKLSKELNKPMVKILEEQKIVKVETIQSLLNKHLKIPFRNLELSDFDESVVYTIPATFAREKKVLPIKKVGNVLELAMVNPLDAKSISKAKMLTGNDVQPIWVKEEVMNRALDFFHPINKVEAPPAEAKKSPEITFKFDEEKTAVQLVVSIIEGAIKARATDIHLEPQEKGLRLRYRIDGILYDISTIPEKEKAAIISRLKVLADMNITEKRKPQDGHFFMNVSNEKYNMRVSTLPTVWGEKIVIRLLKEKGIFAGLQKLGFHEDDYHIFKGLISKPNGMILVTGPVGSGKTTTLYSTLSEMNVLDSNIVTIEDPIEYQIPGITQVQVNHEIGLDYATGLKAILRQDPDVIMIGEIRDAETAKVGIWAALTGQLVLSTLHTGNAAGAINMLRNLGGENFLIANSLIGVVAQRLVRVACPHCKEFYTPNPAELRSLGFPEDEDIKLVRTVGCEKCFFTGFLGRTGIFEVLKVDDKIKTLILKEASERELENAAINAGMRSLRINGLDKIRQGITTTTEVLKEIII